MAKNSTLMRHGLGLAVTVAGFALSVQLSDRGLLFNPETPGALASAPLDGATYDLQALTVLNRVLLQMKDNYVDPDRIDPLRMLVHALDRVQNEVPEVVTLFDADLDARPSNVEVHVGAASQSFELGDVESLWEMSFKLREIFRFVQEHVDSSDIDLRDIEYAAINGMLGTLDPHTVLLTPDIYAEMQTANHGSFGGLGISIGIRNGQLTVITPMPDTPASRAGFRSGDVIVQINGESTVNMPLDDAVSRLRGPEGSDVVVEIMRQGWSEPHSYTLRREIIQIESVTHHALGDGIGYVAISNFQERTQEDLDDALDALRTELGELNGLVLDLRNNPGGLLSQAISVSDTFLSEGNIVTTVGVGSRMREENSANSAGTEPMYPIVVLINPGSASASEIVAGALKNHDRALIMGDRSFGKGSVQVLYDFPDLSALKLTIAEYLTPGDISIQGVGIVPDVQIYPTTVTDDFIELYPSETAFVREGDLEASLVSERVAESVDRPSMVLRYWEEIEDEAPDEYADPNAFAMDFQIELAQQVLLASDGVWERELLQAAGAEVLAAAAESQMLLIQEELRGRGVDWSSGENVIQPVTLTVDSADDALRVAAGDTLELTLSVRNDGPRTLHQVRAVSSSAYGLLDDREFVFGRLGPGESREWTVEIEVPAEDPSRIDAVDFTVAADEIALEGTTQALVRVDGRERPRFGISYRVDDSEGGNGDGLLQVGESIAFDLMVFNVGAGDAGETSVLVRNQSDRALFLLEGRDETEQIAAGEVHVAPLGFRVDEVPESGSIELTAEVFDSVYREYLRETILLPVSTDAAAPQVRSGTAATAGEAAPVLAGASSDALPIAEMPVGSALAFDRYANGFYHVSWGDDEGWVAESSVTIGAGAALDSPLPTPRVAFEPPTITLTTTALETNEATWEVRGTIADDGTVRDYYVVVQNLVEPRRMRSLKRAYGYVGAASVEFSETVELREGMNRITVVARDDEKAVSTQEIFVFRNN